VTEETAAFCRLLFVAIRGGQSITQELRVNDRIRAREVRLVAPDGSQIGVKSIEEARWLADQLEMDLVEVAPAARPPVCKIMDYGKYKYEQSVRQREARKKQTRTVIKEVKFRPKIDSHDYEVKKRRVVEFLGEGDKVKVTMMFRGREVTHPEIGERILRRLAGEVEERGVIEQSPRLEGRNMTMQLAPLRRQRQDAEAAPGASGAVSEE
jgi:translation initiation factor IF-3